MASLWDDEADVVIVGYGGAGASAAVAAHDAGAKVLIVEKNDGGGNTKLATRPLSARRIMQPLSSTSKRCHPARWTSRRWILVSTGCPKTMTLSGSSVEKLKSVRREQLFLLFPAPRL